MPRTRGLVWKPQQHREEEMGAETCHGSWREIVSMAFMEDTHGSIGNAELCGEEEAGKDAREESFRLGFAAAGV